MPFEEQYVGQFIVDGVDLYSRFGMILTNDFDLGQPEPKTHYVDIPAANGSLDLTDAMSGDTVYENREQTFVFAVLNVADIGTTMTKIRNFLHGKRYEYQIIEDPGYTYTGRFTVSDATRPGLDEGGADWLITVDIEADPYKIKGTYTYALKATGGYTYTFESGRMPVHPLVDSDDDFYIEFEGESYNCYAGAYSLRFITFHEGENKIYITAATLENVTWEDAEENGNLAMTWDEMANYTWSDIQKLQYWHEDEDEVYVYLQYEWGDL